MNIESTGGAGARPHPVSSTIVWLMNLNSLVKQAFGEGVVRWVLAGNKFHMLPGLGISIC